jgi:hypothetical protein
LSEKVRSSVPDEPTSTDVATGPPFFVTESSRDPEGGAAAAAAAARRRGFGDRGEMPILMMDFSRGFFGCFFAGMVVPRLRG